VEQWAEIRRLHFVKGLSQREIRRPAVGDSAIRQLGQLDDAVVTPAELPRDMRGAARPTWVCPLRHLRKLLRVAEQHDGLRTAPDRHGVSE
jgi:hypothetical protein